MKAYFHFVLRHRVLVGAFFLFVTLLSAASISRAVVASSMNKLFFGESPEYQKYVERLKEFGTEEVNIFAFDSPDALEEGAQERLRLVIDRILDVEGIGRVFSIFDAQNLEGRDGTLYISKYADDAIRDPSRIPELMTALRGDALVGSVIISRDGRHIAILPEVDPELQGDMPAERGPALIGAILEIFEEEGYSPSGIHRAGFLVTLAEVVNQTYYNLKSIFPFVVLTLLLTVWLMFHRLWPAVIATAASILAVIWTMGFAVQLDREVNILMATVPAVIIIVGFSDVVHLCSAYLLELGRGLTKDQAILKSAEDVGKACFYTSLTTFAGFLCLSLVPTPMFRSLGVILGLGVASALLIAMTLVPIFFSLMPEPKPLREGSTSFVHQLLDRLLAGMERLATQRAWAVIAGSALVLVLALVGLSRLTIGADFAKRLSKDNRVNQDLTWFEDRFAGTTGLDLYVEVPDPDGLFDPDVFRNIAKLQDRLLEMPRVDDAVSLVDLMREIHREINEQDGASPSATANSSDLPDSREALAQYLLLFEMGGGEDLDRLVDFERRQMRITLRLNDEEFRASAEVAAEAVALGATILGDSATVDPSGLSFLLGDWLDEILAGQRNGLLLSILMITFMMMFALRSVRAGLWSMIPNVFPLIVLGGYLGGTWDYVDSDSLILAIMAIGIGVDDTIHFLVRFRIESGRSANTAEAIGRTFDFAGRAIVMTTIILAVGFFPFALSDYYSTHMMGTLLPLCLIIALLADLLIVPAFAKIGLISFPNSGHSAGEPE